jgi:hypothetical protein
MDAARVQEHAGDVGEIIQFARNTLAFQIFARGSRRTLIRPHFEGTTSAQEPAKRLADRRLAETKGFEPLIGLETL